MLQLLNNLPETKILTVNTALGLTEDIRPSVEKDRRPEVEMAGYLKKIHVIDAHDWGKGDPYLICQVVDGISEKPFVTYRAWHNVADDKDIEIPDPGILMYHYEGEAPPFIDMQILLLESDQEIKNIGEKIQTAMNSVEYEEQVNNMQSLIKIGSVPMDAVISLSRTALNVLTSFFTSNEDDFISLVTASYTWRFHELGKGIHPTKDKLFKCGDAQFQWEFLLEKV